MSKHNQQQKSYDDPKEVNEAKSRAKIAALQEKEDYKALMALPAFRRFIWTLLNMTHLFATSFTGNSETFFKEGERNVGLKVFLKIQEHDPEGYAVMVREQTEGEKP